MPPRDRQELQQIPSVTELLNTTRAAEWLQHRPRPLVTECLRRAVASLRQQILASPDAPATPTGSRIEALLHHAAQLLDQAEAPRLRQVINATGIILHTGLGRAVLPESVIEALQAEFKGYVNLAVDRTTGERIERDELVEPLLCELTGAEAATVVNNNAAATLLVLAALAAGREVIVSRGQLVEIGGSFRLPEVMAQSQARLVEVGATNRTHLKDYRAGITEHTAALMRVHPSNYRIIGFTHETPLPDLVELAHRQNLIVIDDLGAGALVDLRPLGLPPEPTVAESVTAGADVVLFSSDKLIGAGQGGIIVGRKTLIDRIRRHPLMRAMRVDKTCLLVLERTLQLFRHPTKLSAQHPTYRMATTPREELQRRAERLAEALKESAPTLRTQIEPSQSYLGSGTLPTQSIPSVQVTIEAAGWSAHRLAQALRLDPAAVFTRIEDDQVRLDMRTLTNAQLPAIAAALGRLTA